MGFDLCVGVVNLLLAIRGTAIDRRGQPTLVSDCCQLHCAKPVNTTNLLVVTSRQTAEKFV